MPEANAPKALSDAEKLDAAADQAIEACGGDAREAVKALSRAVTGAVSGTEGSSRIRDSSRP